MASALPESVIRRAAESPQILMGSALLNFRLNLISFGSLALERAKEIKLTYNAYSLEKEGNSKQGKKKLLEIHFID